MSINSIYTGGDWVDVPYVVSIAIFAVAGICQTRPGMASATQRPARHGVTGVLPYLAPLLILGLLTLAERDHRRGPELILIGVTALVMVLAVVRQFLAQREVVAANRALGDANAEISALAATDSLTGLPNHRTMVAALDLELERAARFGRSCAVLFIDVDHFKTLNDTLGHAGGDQVLSQIGHLLRAAVRTIDTIGRWGGEEFVAIVPESDADAALATAVRIADAIRNHTFVATRGRRGTCSIGVAAYPQNGALHGAVLESADRAMYAAKSAGRNSLPRTRSR